MTIPYQQRGATLIVSLILLMVMTLLAVTAMQNTTLEEKMAGNTRDMHLALSAAETGLRCGESELTGTAVLPPFNGSTAGYYAADNSRWMQATTWTDTTDTSTSPATTIAAGSKACATAVPGVCANPRYYLEEMPAVTTGGSLEVGVAMEVGMYRVTAYGCGAANVTTAIVQSTFRR